MYDVVSPYTSFLSMYPSGATQSYVMNAGTTIASQHSFYTYNNTTQIRSFQIQSTQNISRLPLVLTEG